MKFVYIDQIKFFSGLSFARNHKSVNLICLDQLTKFDKLFQYLLKLFGINVVQANFFAGDFKALSGEAVPIAASTLSCKLSLIAARKIISTSPSLSLLNLKNQRGTIELSIAKKLQSYIYYWTVRSHMVLVLSKEDDRPQLWIKRPLLFPEIILIDSFPNISYKFYETPKFHVFWLFFNWFKYSYKNFISPLWKQLLNFDNRCFNQAVTEPSVLLFQENTNIRSEKRLRAQPVFWINTSHQPPTYPTYLIETQSFGLKISKEYRAKLAEDRIYVLPQYLIRKFNKQARNSDVLKLLRTNRRFLLKELFSSYDFMHQFFLLEILNLLKESECMAALVLGLNAKVFISREPQFSYTDALQLISKNIGISTISYQYSNLGSLSPLMISTSDFVLAFSDAYTPLLLTDTIAPGKLIENGYLYDSVFHILRKEASKTRVLLESFGASFVVCYFDETVTPHKYGLVSKAHHLSDLRALAQWLLSDASVAVVVKSQYIRNNPSNLYPNDDLLVLAVKTGRWYELCDGIHRNEIYPAEAALASDLVISQKFGATAALESALIGVRTLLLDGYGLKTVWDSLYRKANILYPSMDAVIHAAKEYRQGVKGSEFLGDWSKIVHQFDPFMDGKATHRIQRLIEEQLFNNGRGKVNER